MHGLYKMRSHVLRGVRGFDSGRHGSVGIGRRHLPVCGHGAGRRAGARVHPSESRRS